MWENELSNPRQKVGVLHVAEPELVMQRCENCLKLCLVVFERDEVFLVYGVCRFDYIVCFLMCGRCVFFFVVCFVIFSIFGEMRPPVCWRLGASGRPIANRCASYLAGALGGPVSAPARAPKARNRAGKLGNICRL